MRTKLVVGLLFLGLSACGTDGDPLLDNDVSSAEEIVGGTPTQGYPGVVALYGKKPGEEKGMLCTASVIAPRVLLTAAHCVSTQTAGEGLQYRALFGYDLTKAETAGPVVNVTAVYAHPKFNSNAITSGYDIGVAILESDAPVAPIAFNKAALTNALVGKPATLVGYGLSNGFQQTGAGVKRVLVAKLNKYDNLLVQTGSFNKGICNGDSGGPVLMTINNVQTVVGVNSFGMIYCIGTKNSTRVDKYIDFINQYL